MRPRAAIEKAIDMLRAAGDNDSADALVLELADEDSGSDDVGGAIVVVESDGPAAGSPPDPVAGEIAIIEAQAEANVAVIEAQAEADVARIEAQADAAEQIIEASQPDDEPEPEPEPVIVADSTGDPDPDEGNEPDPDPRTTHPFYRPLFRKHK